MTLAAGARLGPYEVVAFLGAGGMGEVWRARDTRLERDVALKVLPASAPEEPAARARLLREARLASKLNPPNVCTIHEVGEANGRTFIAMELVEGETLSARLAAGAFPPAEVRRIGMQVAEALGHAHAHGVLHRDLKSANIVLTPEGRAKVLDFGLAKRFSQKEAEDATTVSGASLTVAGTLTGTVAYMAPEQLLGKPADTRSDLWALGVVLYEMATGSLPFSERLSTALIEQILHGNPQPPRRIRPEIPKDLESVILRCLERDPAERFGSAQELLEALGRPLSAAHGSPPSASRFSPRVAWGLAAALVLVLAGAGYLLWKRPLPAARPGDGRVMLAVLPVDNLSGDAGQEFFSDGLTEELIAQLGAMTPARLGVIARTSAMRYKKTEKPIDQVGRELGVGYVLESSVRKEGGRVRITAQLIGVKDQTHLWAESYERDVSGILAIQSEVAEKVARALAITLLPSEKARLAGSRPVNPEAHELCLKGRHHWNLRTSKDLLKATENFRAAIAADPSFALAWTGLADTYALYPFYNVLAERTAFPQARATAEKAFAIDPTLVEAETTLAFVTFYFDWDWAGAEKRMTAILERRPDYAIARQWYAEYLTHMGRHDESLREIRRARETDPLSPILRVMEGYVLYYARRYEDSLVSLRKSLPLAPDYPVLHNYVALNLFEMGRLDEAREAFLRYRALGGSSVRASTWEVQLLAASGKKDEAKRLFAGLRDQTPKGERFVFGRWAQTSAALGEMNEAVAYAGQAYEERDVLLVSARVDPRFDPLRSDPRFQEIVRKMNFPPG